MVGGFLSHEGGGVRGGLTFVTKKVFFFQMKASLKALGRPGVTEVSTNEIISQNSMTKVYADIAVRENKAMMELSNTLSVNQRTST